MIISSYQGWEGSEDCELCPEGLYRALNGSEECDSCDENSTTLYEGSQECSRKFLRIFIYLRNLNLILYIVSFSGHDPYMQTAVVAIVKTTAIYPTGGLH